MRKDLEPISILIRGNEKNKNEIIYNNIVDDFLLQFFDIIIDKMHILWYYIICFIDINIDKK